MLPPPGFGDKTVSVKRLKHKHLASWDDSVFLRDAQHSVFKLLREVWRIHSDVKVILIVWHDNDAFLQHAIWSISLRVFGNLRLLSSLEQRGLPGSLVRAHAEGLEERVEGMGKLPNFVISRILRVFRQSVAQSTKRLAYRFRGARAYNCRFECPGKHLRGSAHILLATMLLVDALPVLRPLDGVEHPVERLNHLCTSGFRQLPRDEVFCVLEREWCFIGHELMRISSLSAKILPSRQSHVKRMQPFMDCRGKRKVCVFGIRKGCASWPKHDFPLGTFVISAVPFLLSRSQIEILDCATDVERLIRNIERLGKHNKGVVCGICHLLLHALGANNRSESKRIGEIIDRHVPAVALALRPVVGRRVEVVSDRRVGSGLLDAHHFIGHD